MRPEQQTEYIVQCLRDSGSMYEDDARKFLAEHDNHVRATALAEAKVEVVAWLVKKAAEGNDPIERLASKVDRGAVRIFLGTGHYRDAMDAHRVSVLTEAIDGLTECLRLGGLTQRGLVLARKRLVALRDGGPLEKPRRNVRHHRIAERCRKQPGKWLTVGDYANDQSAYGIAHSIKTGMRIPAYMPAGAYEARIEQTDTGARVHARYVGQTTEAAR